MTAEEREVVASLQAASGRIVAGAFAFGDSPALADELLGFVRRGSKRATAGAVAELEAADAPVPEPGLCWGLLDGRGEPWFVMETTEVRIGRLDSVDAAFAWDEGENDRTYEDWLGGHRRYFRRQGITDPDHLEVAFERFRIVWPEEDVPVWLADGVREVGIADRPWAGRLLRARYGEHVATPRGPVDPTGLPALLAERDREAVGLLTFRPRPGGTVDVVTIDAVTAGSDVTTALIGGIGELADQEGWSSVRLPEPRGPEGAREPA